LRCKRLRGPSSSVQGSGRHVPNGLVQISSSIWNLICQTRKVIGERAQYSSQCKNQHLKPNPHTQSLCLLTMDYSATSSSPSFPNAQPFVGIVENTIHALRLVQAARQGLIPRIIRRLNDSERRQMITSGAVFVFSVEESGIKRWTDSMVWSPSRIVGNFLVSRRFR
jgi:hypothetical protein